MTTREYATCCLTHVPPQDDDSMEIWRLARIGDWSLTSRQSPITSPGLDMNINVDSCAFNTRLPPRLPPVARRSGVYSWLDGESSLAKMGDKLYNRVR